MGQMCDRISQPDGLGIEMARTIDTRTVLMDGHLVRPQQEGVRERQPERLRRFQ